MVAGVTRPVFQLPFLSTRPSATITSVSKLPRLTGVSLLGDSHLPDMVDDDDDSMDVSNSTLSHTMVE